MLRGVLWGMRSSTAASDTGCDGELDEVMEQHANKTMQRPAPRLLVASTDGSGSVVFHHQQLAPWYYVCYLKAREAIPEVHVTPKRARSGQSAETADAACSDNTSDDMPLPHVTWGDSVFPSIEPALEARPTPRLVKCGDDTGPCNYPPIVRGPRRGVRVGPVTLLHCSQRYRFQRRMLHRKSDSGGGMANPEVQVLSKCGLQQARVVCKGGSVVSVYAPFRFPYVDVLDAAARKEFTPVWSDA